MLLTLYDTLGIRTIGHPLPYRRIALASFIGYAFNNNLGMAGVAGNGLRYRIYTTWGLSALDVAKVIGFCVMTFWMGFLTMAGVFVSRRSAPDSARTSAQNPPRFRCVRSALLF